MRTLFISFGTRPEAIKMAPVVLELHRRKRFRVVTCLTGQHREMLDQVIDAFGLPVDHDLGVMRIAQTLTHITTAVLQGLETLLDAESPDMVLVHGDTTTTTETVATTTTTSPIHRPTTTTTSPIQRPTTTVPTAG